jgi:hypothetical protein
LLPAFWRLGWLL